MQAADACAQKPFHFVADLINHPADLPVHALTQNHPQSRRADQVHAGKSCSLALEEHALEQLLREARIPPAIERNFIFLLHLVTRMGQLLREIAVISEEKQTLSWCIEPADVDEMRKLSGQQIVDRVGGVGIAACADKTGRLVQGDSKRLRRPNESMIDLHMVVRFHPRAEIRARLAVDRDASGGNELVALPTGAKTSRSEVAVEAHTRRVKKVKRVTRLKRLADLTI